MRQFVSVKFRTADARAYTYHHDGEPLAAGEVVKVPSARELDGWSRATVVEVFVPEPSFPTKAIIGRIDEPRTAVEEGDDAGLEKWMGERS